jgi:hypothetical protein
MFRVYWTEHEVVETPVSKVCFQDFELQEMTKALQFAESLRCRQRSGDTIRHITISSENPDSVGKSGVADPPANYTWKKRRI